MNRRTCLVCFTAFAASLVIAGDVGWTVGRIKASVPMLLEMAHRSEVVAHVYVTDILRPRGMTILADLGCYAKCGVKETLKGTNLPANIQINFGYPSRGPEPPIATNREFIVFLRKWERGWPNPDQFLPIDQQLGVLAYDAELLRLVKLCATQEDKKEAEK